MQSPTAEKEVHALLRNNPNPFVPTGTTYSINNLPPELLSRIFEVGDSDDEDGGADAWIQGCNEGLEEGCKIGADNDVEIMMADDKKVEVESPSFQIVVSQVCRHWRNVALSTPSLWTDIEVTPDARPPYENVLLLLERSKALPIDIYIDYSPERYDPDSVDCEAEEDDLKSLYSLLVPHVQRWRSITVETSSYYPMYTFLSAVSDPSVPVASQLATLQLYNSRYGDIQPKLSNHFTLFGSSAPNLTTLTLEEVHVDWNQGWIASASNLRYLTLMDHTEDVRPTWAQFATILRGAPQLETLSLFESGPSGEPAEWVFEPTPGRPTGDLNAPIQLLNLTDFVLASRYPSPAMGLFPKFYLPSLKSLTLHLEEDDYTDLINQLAGPATSISPLSAEEQPRSLLSSLETLKILELQCSSEGVETLYSELQNLQSLHLTSQFYNPRQFVDILCRPCTLPGRGDIWLPRLKSLWISCPTGDRIRQVVQQRKDAGVPLKTLYVERQCKVDDDDVEWFRENVETFKSFAGRDDYGDAGYGDGWQGVD